MEAAHERERWAKIYEVWSDEHDAWVRIATREDEVVEKLIEAWAQGRGFPFRTRTAPVYRSSCLVHPSDALRRGA